MASVASPPYTEQQRGQLASLKEAGVLDKLDVENLVFEGGGAKCIAYVGAVQVLEDLGVLPNVRRFAGASGGAAIAVLLAIRTPVEEIFRTLEDHPENWITDAFGGKLALFPNLVWKFGWNPCNKLVQVFSRVIDARFTEELAKKREAGQKNPQVTFMDIYKKFGTEVCLVTTNVSTKSIQYHHPKITPSMPVIAALKASAALPVMCQPVWYGRSVLVDGGVLSNLPLHVYDGWYLSMDPKDSFFHSAGKQRPAFQDYNPKTLAFLLVAMGEKDPLGTRVEEFRQASVDVEDVHFPDTELKRKKADEIEKHIESKRTMTKLSKAARHLLEVFETCQVSEQDTIALDDFKTAYRKNPLAEDEVKLLFGDGSTPESIFKVLDSEPDNQLTFCEFLSYMQERGIKLTSQFDESDPPPLPRLQDFVESLVLTLNNYSNQVNLKERDPERCAKISTWYVDTIDTTLEKADIDFLFQQGAKACLKHLEISVTPKTD